MHRLKNLVIHPFLVAAYPILALLSHNVEEIGMGDALRSLIAAQVAAAILLTLTRLIFKDWRKAGLVTSITLIFFFSYGHIYAAIKGINATALMLGRHRLLVPLFIILWALLVWWVARLKSDLRMATQTITLIAAIALVFPVFNISRYLVRSATYSVPELQSQAGNPGALGYKPDIYYIILDGYARDDVLADLYGYDNRAFLGALEDMGFQIAECSLSNYAQTQLSVASSMNMNYLQSIDEIYADPQNGSRAGLTSLIRQSAVRQFLEGLGYKIVSFESGWGWTDIFDADFFLAPSVRSANYMGLMSGTNDFEVILIKTSGGILVADATIKLPELLTPDLNSPKKVQRARIQYILDVLPLVPRMTSPKFVFAHIVTPHTPFLFDADGGPIEGEVEGADGYRDQVTHINKRILPILRGIIQDSENPPIIILQADHGWALGDPQGRMRILNAYYLPEADEAVDASITPVNTFRMILDEYFEAGYDRLEDLSYYSKYEKPYDYTLIEDTRLGCP